MPSENKTRTKPECKNSTACGKTCIAKGLDCKANIGKAADITVAVTKFTDSLSGESKREKGGGAGSASLTETEVNDLLANEDFLRTATPQQITDRAIKRGLSELAEDGGGKFTEADLDAVTEAVWQNLSTATKQHLKRKGSLAEGNYLNPETGEHGKSNEIRSKFLLRRFIEQNGRDAYTGQPITLTGSDLEHIEPFGVHGLKAERKDNLVFTAVSVNQRKAESTLVDFFDSQVLPVQKAMGADPKYWSKQGAKTAANVGKKNAIDDLLKEKTKDSWTDEDVDTLKGKYYYAGRAMGHNPVYTKTRPRGVSGQTFSTEIGKPLMKAFAAAYRDKDDRRIAELESVRKQLVEAAVAESAEKKGNAGAKDGLMYEAFTKLRDKHKW